MGCGKSKHAVIAAEPITMKRAGRTNVDPKVGKDIVEETKDAPTIVDNESLPLEQVTEGADENSGYRTDDVSKVMDMTEENDMSIKEEKKIEEENGQEIEEEKEGGNIVMEELPEELSPVELSEEDLSKTKTCEEETAESERAEYASPHPSEVGKEHSSDEIAKLDEALQRTGLIEEIKPTETNEDEPASTEEVDSVEEVNTAEVQVSTTEGEEKKD